MNIWYCHSCLTMSKGVVGLLIKLHYCTAYHLLSYYRLTSTGDMLWSTIFRSSRVFWGVFLFPSLFTILCRITLQSLHRPLHAFYDHISAVFHTLVHWRWPICSLTDSYVSVHATLWCGCHLKADMKCSCTDIQVCAKRCIYRRWHVAGCLCTALSSPPASFTA